MTGVLSVENLCVSFRQDGNSVDAVRNVSFTVKAGETVAMVREGELFQVRACAALTVADPRGSARHAVACTPCAAT